MIKNVKVEPYAISHAQRMMEIRRRNRIREIIFKTKIGVAIFTAGVSMYASAKPLADSPLYVNEKHAGKIRLDRDAINDLNIILVNDGVDSNFYENTIKSLKEKDIQVQSIVGSSQLQNIDGTQTIISLLDYKGEGSKVIAQHHDRQNQSDALALGILAGLESQKLKLADMNPQCGVHKMNEDGYTLLGPSELEEKVGDISNRFVSIAVPKDTDIDSFTEGLTEGLARFQYHISHDGAKNYITRVEAGDNYEILSAKTNLSKKHFVDKYPSLVQDQTIVTGRLGVLSSDVEVIMDHSVKKENFSK